MTEMVGNVGVILVNQLHAYPNVDAIAHAAHGIRLAAILVIRWFLFFPDNG